MPAPGDDAQLRELVGRIMSEPLDQERPLWQLYLIERGPGKGFAAVSKTHHALVDGVSAVDVGAIILDPDPEGTDLGLSGESWIPKERRRTDQVIADRVDDARRKILGIPREAAKRALDTSTPQSAFRTAQGFLDLARNSDPVRLTFLNEEIGRDRRVAFASTTLAAMKAAGAAAGDGATVNDAVLSVSAGALRRLFADARRRHPRRVRRARPDEHPQARRGARTRQPDHDADGAAAARRARPARAPPQDPRDDDAAEELGGRTRRLDRDRGIRLGAADDEPGARHGRRRARAGTGSVVPQRIPWNLVISNVPGPPMPVYLLGRPLRSIHPFVALSPQRRALSIGVISYDGGLFFGLAGDRDRLPDIDRLAGFIDEELNTLVP